MEPHDLIWASFAYPGGRELELLTWARSIREFGGSLAKYPIWVMIPNSPDYISEPTRRELRRLGAELKVCPVPQKAFRFPLADKVYGAAAAESLAVGKTRLLVWMDSDNIIVNEPELFQLPPDRDFGYRPVMHCLIGPRYDEPPDAFWQLIYERCNVPDDRFFPMVTPVDSVTLKPYFNAGHMVLRPEKSILRTWRTNFDREYRLPEFRTFYRQSSRYVVFMHQAILTGTILNLIPPQAMLEFPETYNYSLNLYEKIPARRRISNFGQIITARYDEYYRNMTWLGSIPIDEPYRSWLADQFRAKDLNILIVLSRYVGAGYFMNRDEFEKYGWEVTLTGMADTLPPCRFYDRLGVAPFVPELKLTDINRIDHWDGLVLAPATVYAPGPYSEIIGSSEALRRIRTAHEQRLPILSVCSAGRVAAAADIIRGRRFTGNITFKDEYLMAGADFIGNDNAPVIDGHLASGVRDQYNNYVNCMALATLIEQRQPRSRHKQVVRDPYIFCDDAGYPDSSIIWSKTIGGFGADGARHIAAARDGGFILTGYTFSHRTRDADILVVKTDVRGEMEWYRTCGGAGTEYGNHCLVLPDGYLITGYTTSFGAGSKDIYIIKLDNEGKIEWQKSYGGPGWEVGCAATRTLDGYAIAGFCATDSLEEQVLALKITTRGKEVWQRKFGGRRYEIASGIVALPDGELVIAATTGSYGGRNSDFWLLKTDANGNRIWDRHYGTSMMSALNRPETPTFDWCTAMTTTQDGGFVLTGYTNCQDIMNLHIVKIDAQGAEQWSQTLGHGFYDYGFAVTEDGKGELIVCGTSKSVDGDNNVLLARLNVNGEVLKQTTFGHRRSDWGSGVVATDRDGVIIAGHTASAGAGSYDMLLARLRF